jgi:hypothetical protein
MANQHLRIGLFCSIAAIILGQSIAVALPIGEAIVITADRLDAEQIKYGENAGTWPAEAEFTGSIVAGMAGAWQLTCEPAYLTSAELGGDYILWAALGNFYGDEAFALTRLSEISTDPCNNTWRTEVSDFYSSVKNVGGTEAYISQFAAGAEPSTTVFYLANYVVAAYYVNAEDKEIWRQGLIDWLAQVDNSSSFPVMAMGVATWALAFTGPLDDTFIDPSGTGAPYWNLKKLSDLPEMLLSHQVPKGQLYAGSFYWRFDHGGSPGGAASGYTEDTIFGALGLIAASKTNPDLNLDAAILAARQALLGGIYGEGVVYNHLWLKGTIYYTYAGEMLQVLGALVFDGDINLNGSVDFIDFAIFANQWGAAGCTPCCWCNRADLDHSGEVDFADLKILTENWLKGASE